MIRIKQHIPNFVERDEPPEVWEFSSVAQLVGRFDGESLSVAEDDRQPCLMTTKPDGSFWVLGYVEGGVDELASLPRWSPPDAN